MVGVTSRSDALRALGFGEDVAEHETQLADYFISTPGFWSLVSDEVDMLVGPKGSGKSAIARYLCDPDVEIPALDSVDVIPAFNIQGSILFRRLTEAEYPRDEQSLRTLFFTYIVGLFANHVVLSYPNESQMTRELLRRVGLFLEAPTQRATLGQVLRRMKPKIEAGVGFDESGVVKLSGAASFEESEDTHDDPLLAEVEAIADSALAVLNTVNRRVWVIFDRLDEAFAPDRELEMIALRALMRAHLDLASYGRTFRTKLFLRSDVLSIATRSGGFANYSHIRQSRIHWDREDLSEMILRRVRKSGLVSSAPELARISGDVALLRKILPRYLGAQHNVQTLEWLGMVTRDGSRELNPRNVLTLLRHARSHAIDLERSRSHQRVRRPPTDGGALIGERSLIAAHRSVSLIRLEDTVLAEGIVEEEWIDALRGRTLDFSKEELEERLHNYGVAAPAGSIGLLVQAGVLRRAGGRYTIPTLYRPALAADNEDLEPSRGGAIPDLDYGVEEEFAND